MKLVKKKMRILERNVWNNARTELSHTISDKVLVCVGVPSRNQNWLQVRRCVTEQLYKKEPL